MERRCQKGMTLSRWKSSASSLTLNDISSRASIMRMSSSVWQHSSGKVGAACGHSAFSPTISSPAPM